MKRYIKRSLYSVCDIIDHMPKYLTTILGKAISKAAKLRGGGSALPGLVIERIDPDFIPRTLQSLKYGVVVISGTNGKTTTTKMVVELLEAQGLTVFSNKTGSNFTRGVAAALLSEIDIHGKLDADIAVVELDEAHAIHFVAKVKPKYSLLLNVMRDQLDRFGEIDYTASLLQKIAESTTDAVVLNREDPRVLNISNHIKTDVVYFGLDQSLKSKFPSDDELHKKTNNQSDNPPADVVLKSFSSPDATFVIDKTDQKVSLSLSGLHNVFNAAAAMTLVRTILKGELNSEKLLKALSSVKPAFGRGETLTVNGQPLELMLVKNPSGFRLSLETSRNSDIVTMIAINDNYADGRDVSWLWDVDFESLKELGVDTISGSRAYDMAIRLNYEDITTRVVNTNLEKSLRNFISSNKKAPKRIYCTYTAMTSIRKMLGKITDVEKI